jgi:hypothetical protein
MSFQNNFFDKFNETIRKSCRTDRISINRSIKTEPDEKILKKTQIIEFKKKSSQTIPRNI